MSHYKRSIRQALAEARGEAGPTFVEGTQHDGKSPTREQRRHMRHPVTGKVFNLINPFSHSRKRWNPRTYS